MSLELVPTMDTQLTTSFEKWQLEELTKPLNTALIRERKGPGGKMLKYIKGSDAIAQANQIFGIGKWGYRVLSRGRETVGDRTFYTADVELYVLGCPFPFPGEGEGVPQDNTVDQHTKARKEAVTDALKRALRHYGDQFGLCLYDEESLVENESGNLVPVKNVHPSNTRPAQPEKPKVVDADKQTVAITRGDLYATGEAKGLWSRTSPEKFYAWASSISARPQSKSAWDMTIAEMGEMAKRIYAEPGIPSSK